MEKEERHYITLDDDYGLYRATKGMPMTKEELELIRESVIFKIDVYLKSKKWKIFLMVRSAVPRELIKRAALYIRYKHNPGGIIEIYTRPYVESGGKYIPESELRIKGYEYGKISTEERGGYNEERLMRAIELMEKYPDSTPYEIQKMNDPLEVEVESEEKRAVEVKRVAEEKRAAEVKREAEPVKAAKRLRGAITKIEEAKRESKGETITTLGKTGKEAKFLTFKTGTRQISFTLSDGSDGIVCKKLYKAGEKGAEEFNESVKGGKYLKVRGRVKEDGYLKEQVLMVERIEELKREEREDKAEEKRIELHCHSKMSAMDAVMTASEIIERAWKWGWEAVAITDHGVVQAFPEMAAAQGRLKKRGINLKVIYGMEGYLISSEEQKYANHVIILAKDRVGLWNLYRLVTLSNLRYFNRVPRIPKEELEEHREGLIIGSACEAGELIRAIVAEEPEEELEKIAQFYDYLEIQPIHNNDFLIRSGEFPQVQREEDLIKINLKVEELARKLNKPLVATTDAHFMNKEDAIYRAILMHSKGFKDAEKQPPLYMRTTEEMLREFEYLGQERAREAVIENPRRIAEQIEELEPIPSALYSPELKGAEEELKRLSYKKAHEIYGEELPEQVRARMEQELKPILKHGYSALYMIAHRLVKKSNADGYIVGSRGSVGSSLIAAMLDITEVNPLPPHYVCPKCRETEFIDDGSVNCGFDLEDKSCPKCGTQMRKDGHDIPFAVFMGFDGDKVPDIDLNFSGEYQATAHKYTEVLFGKYNVYRAGTIAGAADKTAYGLVKKYFEDRGEEKHGAYIGALAEKCTGVKRTTGQHPAGIMVVPRDMDVHYFTPLQYPADDKSSKTITTHFDYHSISERLVKLDILGHDDPTMLKMLEDLTGIDARKIPLDDKETMSLFTSTKALGVSAEELGSATGAFGIPEFRTAFTRQMIELTKPKCFSDLVRISGFSHGTDVWLGNAQELIKSGTCELKEAISARDDIMMYLIYKGVDPLLSFKTMEGVRKGRGIKAEVVEELKKHKVPDWYIEACQKIKYLFPRAHATAYVIMAFRIAYFKVHRPLEYYAAYFTIRADEFDADEVIKGAGYVKEQIRKLESREEKLDVKETAQLTMYQVVHEMRLRGYGIKRVDLKRSKAKRFIIEGKELIPPFASLSGLGETAAAAIEEAREESEFSSIADLKKRAGLNKANLEVLEKHGCLEGMLESNQMSLF